MLIPKIVAFGVTVGVAVGVRVAVRVGVWVGVAVGVRVGVGVGVCVAVSPSRWAYWLEWLYLWERDKHMASRAARKHGSLLLFEG